ncbi:hypothetical protein [Allocoleopsis franciscana]|uniref:hypothetical protein n=1 Tax=Allocoleopsis franciscana TaxID=2886352 RepID=UPI0002E61FD5|nr:hypothetical protein [Allocoleopsis franciscana]
MTTAKSSVQEFDDFQALSPEIQAEIERLSRQPYLELDHIKECHIIYGCTNYFYHG